MLLAQISYKCTKNATRKSTAYFLNDYSTCMHCNEVKCPHNCTHVNIILATEPVRAGAAAIVANIIQNVSRYTFCTTVEVE